MRYSISKEPSLKMAAVTILAKQKLAVTGLRIVQPIPANIRSKPTAKANGKDQSNLSQILKIPALVLPENIILKLAGIQQVAPDPPGVNLKFCILMKLLQRLRRPQLRLPLPQPPVQALLIALPCQS